MNNTIDIFISQLLNQNNDMFRNCSKEQQIMNLIKTNNILKEDLKTEHVTEAEKRYITLISHNYHRHIYDIYNMVTSKPNLTNGDIEILDMLLIYNRPDNIDRLFKHAVLINNINLASTLLLKNEVSMIRENIELTELGYEVLEITIKNNAIQILKTIVFHIRKNAYYNNKYITSLIITMFKLVSGTDNISIIKYIISICKSLSIEMQNEINDVSYNFMIDILSHGNPNIVDLLHKNGFDIPSGVCFQIAITNHNYELLKYLLKIKILLLTDDVLICILNTANDRIAEIVIPYFTDICWQFIINHNSVNDYVNKYRDHLLIKFKLLIQNYSYFT